MARSFSNEMRSLGRPIPRLALVAGLLVLCVPGLATGEEQPSTEGAPEPSDLELLARGVELRKLGHDAEALAAFERAYAERPSSRAAAQIALAHQALAHWKDAERELLEALRDTDDPWVARQRSYLEGSLAAVQAHLAWLDVQSNVDGAEVWIEGQRRGRLPLEQPIRLVAGEATFEVRAPGYSPIQRTLRVEGNAHVSEVVTFVVQPVQEPPPPSRDKPAALRLPRSNPAPTSRRAGWIALAGASGLLILGIAAQGTREEEALIYNDDAQCGPVGTLTRRSRCGTNRDIGNAAQVVAIVAFAAGGLAAAASGVLLFGSRGAVGSKASRLECLVAGVGLACGWDF
jgi:PEGA domain